jgi:hemerythrin
MEAQGYPRIAHHAEQHQAMRKALIESLRQVAKDRLTLPVFIQHIKDSFSYHFETDDMTFVTWQKQRQTKESASDFPDPVRSLARGIQSKDAAGSLLGEVHKA